jgi:predicted 3-demethylubiquinone-9 3-methyltransferase (glyoxalase superfamily)
MRALLLLSLAAVAALGLSAAAALGSDDETRAPAPTQKITTFLWFDDDAEEAVRLYTSLFADSRILSVQRAPDGAWSAVRFRLAGQDFMALNGGPVHRFSAAASLFVRCETQEEIDDLWERLTADGGKPGRCGWLEDRFGLSWQIIPRRMEELFASQEPGVAQRVGAAMMQMDKIDIARLEEAARR